MDRTPAKKWWCSLLPEASTAKPELIARMVLIYPCNQQGRQLILCTQMPDASNDYMLFLALLRVLEVLYRLHCMHTLCNFSTTNVVPQIWLWITLCVGKLPQKVLLYVLSLVLPFIEFTIFESIFEWTSISMCICIRSLHPSFSFKIASIGLSFIGV